MHEVPHNCLVLTNHLWTPPNNLPESPLSNVDFSWFIGGCYLKGNSGKHCAGYAIKTPFYGIEAASLPMAILAQQAELYTVT